MEVLPAGCMIEIFFFSTAGQLMSYRICQPSLRVAQISGGSTISQTGAPTPRWGNQPIIWPFFSQNLHENERNWTLRSANADIINTKHNCTQCFQPDVWFIYAPSTIFNFSHRWPLIKNPKNSLPISKETKGTSFGVYHTLYRVNTFEVPCHFQSSDPLLLKRCIFFYFWSPCFTSWKLCVWNFLYPTKVYLNVSLEGKLTKNKSVLGKYLQIVCKEQNEQFFKHKCYLREPWRQVN